MLKQNSVPETEIYIIDHTALDVIYLLSSFPLETSPRRQQAAAEGLSSRLHGQRSPGQYYLPVSRKSRPLQHIHAVMSYCEQAIVISKLLKFHLKAKRRAPAYSRATNVKNFDDPHCCKSPVQLPSVNKRVTSLP